MTAELLPFCCLSSTLAGSPDGVVLGVLLSVLHLDTIFEHKGSSNVVGNLLTSYSLLESEVAFDEAPIQRKRKERKEEVINIFCVLPLYLSLHNPKLSRISHNSLEAWQQFQIYAPPSLHIIRVP